MAQLKNGLWPWTEEERQVVKNYARRCWASSAIREDWEDPCHPSQDGWDGQPNSLEQMLVRLWERQMRAHCWQHWKLVQPRWSSLYLSSQASVQKTHTGRQFLFRDPVPTSQDWSMSSHRTCQDDSTLHGSAKDLAYTPLCKVRTCWANPYWAR